MPGELKVLGARQLLDLRVLLDRDPIAHCFVESRLTESRDAWTLGGEVWGLYQAGSIQSALFVGANMVPIETTAEARRAFAERARRMGRRCSSIVGPADEVLDLWAQLEPAWGCARAIRARQHVMATAVPALRTPHPGLRPLVIEELDLLMPAAVAMFTEEVGVSPIAHGAGPAYRARLAEIIRAGRALGVVEGGRVVFKAEIGSATPRACQVQGVWVAPELRGQGLGVAGMAGVVEHSRTRISPIVSLYVNDFNHAAVATYEAVGFTTVGTFATVLF